MKQRSSDNRVPKPFGKRCAKILAFTREPHAIQMMQDRDAFSSAKMQVWTPKMQGPEQCSVTQQGARVLIHKRNPRHHRHRYKRTLLGAVLLLCTNKSFFLVLQLCACRPLHLGTSTYRDLQRPH